ncbi:hypothetical protein L7F22_022893 [Adiantum nelumboides]|nr:hypothetical protein [Adiantum nelumboides]
MVHGVDIAGPSAPLPHSPPVLDVSVAAEETTHTAPSPPPIMELQRQIEALTTDRAAVEHRVAELEQIVTSLQSNIDITWAATERKVIEFEQTVPSLQSDINTTRANVERAQLEQGIAYFKNECVVLETKYAEAQIQSEFVRMMIAKINKGRRFTLFPRPHIKDEDNIIYALGSCVACGECLGSAHVVEYEVKEEYIDNHAADKHSKAGHMFGEEMEDGGKFCDVEMHKATTHSFQGMSNEVQSNKLDEDKDTTTGTHEGVNDCKEEQDHEVLPDQEDVDKDHPDKDQQDIDKDQKVEVDDDNSLLDNKDGDKDLIIEDPKVDTGGNKVSNKEDPKVDTSVSKEPLEECLPADEEVHKAQFLRDKDPSIGVDVNDHTPGLKAWWLDEPTVIERNPAEDIPKSKGRLIILDVNGVV